MSSKTQNILESKNNISTKRTRLPKNTIGANLLKKKSITRVGETRNFIIDYDSTESLILMYGKEAPTSHGFKLGLDKREVTNIIEYLKQAKILFP
jgi:hypothetical protein